MPFELMGAWQDTILRDRGYFEIRQCWVDCRGTLLIAADAHFGFEVMILSASHSPDKEYGIGAPYRRMVQVDSNAWVGSRALLYDCHIEAHGVVGAGAVVKGVVVPSWTLAEGNPALIVAIWKYERWNWLPTPIRPRRWQYDRTFHGKEAGLNA